MEAPSFVIDGGLESQVADASELALFNREVWFVKTRSFETTPKGVTKIYSEGCMKFEINPNSLRDVTIRKEWGMYDHIKQEDLTPEQLIKIIKGEDRCSSTGSEDHPDFKELRNTLEEQGFIECQRNWSNGDRVLKPFSVNGAQFYKGEKFHCGAAIKYTVMQKQKNKRYKTI